MKSRTALFKLFRKDLGERIERDLGEKMKNKERKLIYWNLIIAISITLLLVVFSFTSVFKEVELKKGITGMAVSEQADNEFIFTFCHWSDSFASSEKIQSIDDMMATGLTHVGVFTRPYLTNVESHINDLTSKGYKIALCIWPGYDNGTFGLPELINKTADNENQFLKWPDSCHDRNSCVIGYDYRSAIDPTYTGRLWNNTLDNIKNITQRVNPEIVLYDIEIWWEGAGHKERLFNKTCNCSIITNGIGSGVYDEGREQRASDLKNIVKQVDSSIEVYFYHEIQENWKRWVQGKEGGYGYDSLGAMPSGSGDKASPSLYVLPNLELLELNIRDMNLSGTLPWVSFTYYYGYGDGIYFDPSVSREAGRMLRKAGTKGFIIYPDAYTWVPILNGKGGNYWLNHSREMVAGFKEGLTYIEKNKIKNPDFESFKTVNLTQFSPVFWKWSDSNSGYGDNATFSNLTREKQSGTYSCRHTRLGESGTRTINSSDFSITENENYTFSIWTKTNINSNNGKIKFYLTNKSIEETIGETSFQSSWNEFKQNINVNSGTYQLKIFIEDNTGQKVDIYFDSVSLIKGFMAIECGDGSCNGNENCSSCPQDCGNCSLVNATSCQERGFYCLTPSNCSSSDRLSYSCNSGVCCSKLPIITNNTGNTTPQDKTCIELQGRICNASEFCNGTISWAKDTNECCLGECIEGTANRKTEPKNDLWFYAFIGGIIIAIMGVVSYIIYEVNKRRGYAVLTLGISVIFLVVVFSFVFMFNDTQKQKTSITGMAISGLGGSQVKAFPEAEGFGAYSLGGRGDGISTPKVIIVDTLEDVVANDEKTSLREAVEASGPRFVVFSVGGIIELDKALVISNPFITIAGQTAPSPGITLAHHGIAIHDKCHDVVIRYIRVRNFFVAEDEGDSIHGLTVGYGSDAVNPINNIIIDHCSFAWAIDEGVSFGEWIHNYTVQWSFIVEGSTYGHEKGFHSMGFLGGGEGSQETKGSLHHNLFAHNAERNPFLDSAYTYDFRNNVVYNWNVRHSALIYDRNPPLLGPMRVNFVNNFYIAGADVTRTSEKRYGQAMITVSKPNIDSNLNPKLYIQGNIGPLRVLDSQPQWAVGVVYYNESSSVFDATLQAYGLDESASTDPIQTEPVSVDFIQRVINGAGVSFPIYDLVDKRLVDELQYVLERYKAPDNLLNIIVPYHAYDNDFHIGKVGPNKGIKAKVLVFKGGGDLNLQDYHPQYRMSPGETEITQELKIQLLASVDETIISASQKDEILSDVTGAYKWSIENLTIPNITTVREVTPAPSGALAQDSDKDGIPNDWEITLGFNSNANDSLGDSDGDGYLNIEEYLNTLPYGCSPSTEVCDGLDNNCDGQIDEENVCSVNQTCEQAGFSCVSGTCNGTIMNYNCTDTGKICCNRTFVTERSCTQRGFYCLPSVNCSSSDILNYECSSGVCCSKLPTNNTVIVPQDKTCVELNGRICNSSQYCNGTISWSKDSNECCLGSCIEEGTANGKEEPKNNFWFYGFIGGLGVLIVGVVGYIIYYLNKSRYY